MINAELKWIDFDNELTRENAQVKLIKPISCFLVLAIGEKGGRGSNYFYLNVYNTAWIQREKFVLGKYSIITDLDDLNELEKYIESFVNNITGETWEDIVEQLRKYFYWEYSEESW